MSAIFPLLAAMALPASLTEQQAQQTFALLNEEARVIERTLGITVAVLPTSDPTLRAFVAQGIMKTDPETFTQRENGLAALWVSGGTVNGRRQAACYIVYNSKRAGHLWRNFIEPMAHAQDLRPGAAFLIGHEVAHCLDKQETWNRVATGSWTVPQAATFGLQPDAWVRAGGGEKVGQRDLMRLSGAIYQDRSQMQYQERVADAFGVLWAWKRQAHPRLLTHVKEARRGQEMWSSHATVPAILELDQFHAQAAHLGFSELWALARGFQVRAGVDKRLALGGDMGGPYPADASKAAPGTPTQAPAPAQPQKPIPFNQLPRFGQRPLGQ